MHGLSAISHCSFCNALHINKQTDSIPHYLNISTLAGLSGGGSVASSMTAGSSSTQERDVMDNEMDLNTETEVIRIHMEQLKRYSCRVCW